MFKEEFANTLRDLLREKGLTASEAARKAGLSPASVNFYVNGNRCPDAPALFKLCNALDVSADYLLGLSPDHSMDIEFKAAYKKLGISEKAANTLHKYRRPALDYFLSEDENDNSWFSVMCDIEAYYACITYVKEHPDEAVKLGISIPYNDIAYCVDINTIIDQYARAIGDKITYMLKARSYKECR